MKRKIDWPLVLCLALAAAVIGWIIFLRIYVF